MPRCFLSHCGKISSACRQSCCVSGDLSMPIVDCSCIMLQLLGMTGLSGTHVLELTAQSVQLHCHAALLPLVLTLATASAQVGRFAARFLSCHEQGDHLLALRERRAVDLVQQGCGGTGEGMPVRHLCQRLGSEPASGGIKTGLNQGQRELQKLGAIFLLIARLCVLLLTTQPGGFFHDSLHNGGATPGAGFRFSRLSLTARHCGP
mmetsp:Transcript_88865/g.237867  ORF Transcript_88865/g.237867 Transcript_88865/m.237867 type:complete len:206 (+) Transcript_88865:1310-1927(+)